MGPLEASSRNWLLINRLDVLAATGPECATRSRRRGDRPLGRDAAAIRAALRAGQGLEGALAGSGRGTNEAPARECDPSSFLFCGVLRHTPQTKRPAGCLLSRDEGAPPPRAPRVARLVRSALWANF